MNQYKTCSYCKQTKPFSDFGKNKSKPLGLDSQCLPCRRASRAKYRKRQVAAIRVQQADNYQRNKEKRIAAATARIKSDRQRHATYMATSKKRNKDKIAADSRRRRAKLKANGVYLITKKERTQLLLGPCFYCGATERITIDHVVAIARGGSDSIGNLVPACKSCNSRKRDLTIMEWRKRGNP